MLAAVVLIPLLLAVRWLGVGIPVAVSRFRPGNRPNYNLEWFAGGISVALALSLSPGPSREVILAITYWVVIFSILVQGLIIRRVAGGDPLGGEKES